MDQPASVGPGPDADRAFRQGILAAALLAVGGLATLLWAGWLTPVHVGFALVVGLPIYLVLAASALSVWLGFDKDESDLRSVRRDRDYDPFSEGR